MWRLTYFLLKESMIFKAEKYRFVQNVCNFEAWIGAEGFIVYFKATGYASGRYVE
jgi:hypothetical protein